MILTNIKGPIFFDFKNFKLSSHLQNSFFSNKYNFRLIYKKIFLL